MSNGEVCCILGVCCPPGSAAQREALITLISTTHPHLPPEVLVAAADRILAAHDHFRDIRGLIEDQDARRI